MSHAVNAATSRAALKEAVAALRAAGVETPVLDARLIVQHALKVDWDTLFLGPDRPLTDMEKHALNAALARRLAREPVSRIVGRRHFWTLDLAVSPATLDPRPDTESVVELALALGSDRQRKLRVLDLGTGTGAILLAILKEFPNATGIGIDRSEGAVAIAETNAASHGLGDRASFAIGDWCTGLTETFDLIVSNPPYIAAQEIAGLAPEVREHDPMEALHGGEDGLEAYRAILPKLSALLTSEGVAILEVGAGQVAQVTALATANGLAASASRNDLGGVERALAFRRA